jgi:hypothetical protein
MKILSQEKGRLKELKVDGSSYEIAPKIKLMCKDEFD